MTSQFLAELEHCIVQEKDWPKDLSEEAKRIYYEERKFGLPTAIAIHPKYGTFVLQTTGQGPYIVWPKEN